MTHNNYIYIAVMALVSYAIRILPLTLIRKPIKNRFVQSFCTMCPRHAGCDDLSGHHSGNAEPGSRCCCVGGGIAAAWFGASLFQVAAGCCAVVFVLEFFI